MSLENIKLEISNEEREALIHMAASGVKGVDVIRKVLQLGMDQLRDIRNINPKGNMGLQALAMQNAYDVVEEINKTIFPGSVKGRTGLTGKTDKPEVTPYR